MNVLTDLKTSVTFNLFDVEVANANGESLVYRVQMIDKSSWEIPVDKLKEWVEEIEECVRVIEGAPKSPKGTSNA